MTARKKKRGPKADRLAIEGDWQAAVKKALGVERPAAGWPEPQKTKRARSRTSRSGRSKS
jgi:hypothetical protein